MAVCLVGATAVFLVTVPLFRGFFDAGVYYGAVGEWIHQDGALYDYLSPGTRYGFTYPPFAAVTMSPMALVSWPAAVAIGVAIRAPTERLRERVADFRR